MKSLLTQARLVERLNYDPTTGVFTWRSAGGGRAAGSVAGAPHAMGYVQLQLDGKNYLAHRLAWLYVTGAFPDAEIDHINGDRSDTRFANLREATHQQNLQNIGRPRNNRSGYLGVHQCARTGRWVAQKTWKGHRRNLGSYASAPEAYEAYLKARRTLCDFQPVPRAS